MNIAVKFCGGCNPTFDRGEAYKNFTKRNQRHHFEMLQEGKDYDGALLICGCSRACLRDRSKLFENKAFIISSREELEHLNLDGEGYVR